MRPRTVRRLAIAMHCVLYFVAAHNWGTTAALTVLAAGLIGAWKGTADALIWDTERD